MGDPVHYFTCCTAVPAVHSDMAVCYGALYCISPDLITLYTVHHIATAGHTGTPNRTYQQVLVLCTMSILVIPQCSVVQYTLLSIPVHRMLTVLQVPPLCTLGTTGTQYSTYPEYSWLVLCVMCSTLLCRWCTLLCPTLYCTLCYVLHTLYFITLATLYVYTEVWRIH